MSDKVDNWYKLASYDNNLTSELHANLLKNNGIRVSTQVLNGIPGMNSGAVLWVQDIDVAKAKQILDSIKPSEDNDNNYSDNNDNSDDRFDN